MIETPAWGHIFLKNLFADSQAIHKMFHLLARSVVVNCTKRSLRSVPSVILKTRSFTKMSEVDAAAAAASSDPGKYFLLLTFKFYFSTQSRTSYFFR